MTLTITFGVTQGHWQGHHSIGGIYRQ